MTSSVDVITPTMQGRERILQDAVASVKTQTVPVNAHLIAMDKNHIGPGLLRNEIVRGSKAEWLVFLDDDDLLDPDFVEQHLQHAHATGADLVYSNHRYPPEYKGWRPVVMEFNETRLRQSNYISVTVLLRTAMFDRVGGFPAEHSFSHEDWWLWLSLLDAKARFSYLPRTCWTYRVHGVGGKL